MPDEKTVAEFLRKIGVELQKGDAISAAADQQWNPSEPVLIAKRAQGVVVWIWPDAKFWDFWDRIHELGQVIETLPKKGEGQ